MNALSVVGNFGIWTGAAGASVELAADSVTQAAFTTFLQESEYPAAQLGAQVWQTPTLLKPKKEVAEKLFAALVAASSDKKTGASKEIRLAIGADGDIFAVGNQQKKRPEMLAIVEPLGPASSKGRQGSDLDFRKNLEEAKTLLGAKTITSIEYKKLIDLLDSIPSAAEMGEANLSDPSKWTLIFQTSVALIGAALRGIEIDYNDFSTNAKLLKRAEANLGTLMKIQGGVLSGEDQSALENDRLALAWQKLPLWGRMLMRKDYRRIKAWENLGAWELAAKLLNDYKGRRDFFRVAFGLMALGIAVKQSPSLNIVRMVVFKKEYRVDHEHDPIPLRPGIPVIQEAVEWRPADLPRGVELYVRGTIPVRPGN